MRGTFSSLFVFDRFVARISRGACLCLGKIGRPHYLPASVIAHPCYTYSQLVPWGMKIGKRRNAKEH